MGAHADRTYANSPNLNKLSASSTIDSSVATNLFRPVAGRFTLAGPSTHRWDEQLLTLPMLREFLPSAASLIASGNPPVWEVRDADSQPIALACLTSPQADKIVGYAGPTMFC